MDKAYDNFQDPSVTEELQHGWWQKLFSCFGCMKQESEAKFKPHTYGTDTPHGHATGLIVYGLAQRLVCLPADIYLSCQATLACTVCG